MSNPDNDLPDLTPAFDLLPPATAVKLHRFRVAKAIGIFVDRSLQQVFAFRGFGHNPSAVATVQARSNCPAALSSKSSAYLVTAICGSASSMSIIHSACSLVITRPHARPSASSAGPT